MRIFSFIKVLFLEKRENNVFTATLMTTGSGGSVRAWSVTGGGLLGHFTAAQGEQECVVSMTTDHDNTMLVTGDTTGFVKVKKSSLTLQLKSTLTFVKEKETKSYSESSNKSIRIPRYCSSVKTQRKVAVGSQTREYWHGSTVHCYSSWIGC